MGKITIKYNKSKSITRVEHKIKYPEVVNLKLHKAINLNVYNGFLPISIEKFKENKKAILVCDVPSLIPLSGYMLRQLNKKQFLTMIKQIISFVRTCEANLLSINNIELRKDCIFVQENNGILNCIYWPLVNYQSYITPANFFKSIIHEINFTNDLPSDFTSKYSSFFSDLVPFSLNNFERMIDSFLGVNSLTSGNSADLIASKSKNQNISNSTKSSDEFYNPLENNRGRDTKKIITSEIGPSDTTAATSNDESKLSGSRYPKLIRQKNLDEIIIDKEKFIVGKDANSCSYQITGNNAISRVHAYFIVNGDRLSIVDNNSTNHVYVNGTKIKPSEPYEVHEGDIIRLANEDFEII